MRKGEKIFFGAVFFLLFVSGMAFGNILGKDVSLKAGPTQPGEAISLAWVETVISPKNVGRGESLSLAAEVTNQVKAVTAVFEDGQKVDLNSKNGLAWKAEYSLPAAAPLGLQTVKFEITSEDGRSISRGLDLFVNLGKEVAAVADEKEKGWPLKVVKEGSVFLGEDNGRGGLWHNTVRVGGGEELRGISKALWYEVQLKDGRCGWIPVSYVKEPLEDYHQCAYEYYKVKEYDCAVKYWQKALQIDPSFVKAHFWLAKGYQKLGKEEEALAELEEVFVLDPKNADALLLATSLAADYFAVAHYDYKSGRYKEAIDGFVKVVRLKPSSISAYLEMGRSYESLGEKEKARNAWKQILALDPENEQALALVGIVLPSVAMVEGGGDKTEVGKEGSKDDGLVLVREGRTDKGTPIPQALGSVVSMTKSLGTRVLERGWSIKGEKDGYKVTFLCEYERGGEKKANLETFEWFVDTASKRVTPTNRNAELLMARW